MKYRKFGKLDYEISALGFGAMRLPTTDNKPFSPNIIEDEAVKMIRYAVDNGINYVDTAFGYHSGKSEEVVGKALKDGYRQKVKLASKSPIFIFKEEGDFEKYLDIQLERLDDDFIDFYLLHTLNETFWNDVVLKFDILNKMEKAKKAGKIGHIGFSFHDKFEVFDKIINDYDNWEFCQIQLNYMNEDYQAGIKGMKNAAEKGLGVIVMEPLLGGKLSKPPKQIMEILNSDNSYETPVDYAFNWLWDKPEISFLLSGMSTMEQVKENIIFADKAKINSFGEQQTKTIEKVKNEFKAIKAVPCTSCSYCMPCEFGVDIPRNFEIYNQYFMYQDIDSTKVAYNELLNAKEIKVASQCTQCKSCEAKCPQHIKISEHMPKVHETLQKL